MRATPSIGKLETTFGGQQEKTASMFVKSSVKAPLIAYRLDMGSYPATEEGFAALMRAINESPKVRQSIYRCPVG